MLRSRHEAARQRRQILVPMLRVGMPSPTLRVVWRPQRGVVENSRTADAGS